MSVAPAAEISRARQEFDRITSASGVAAAEAARMWALAYREGAAKAEETGRKIRDDRRRGADETNRIHRARAAAARAAAVSGALEALAGRLPDGHVRWNVPLLAVEVHEAWKGDEVAPSVYTLRTYLCAAIRAGELPAYLFGTRTTRRRRKQPV